MTRFWRPVRASSSVASWPVTPILRAHGGGLVHHVVAGHPRRGRSSGAVSVVRMRTPVVLPAPLGPSTPRMVPDGDLEVDLVQGLRLAVALRQAPRPRSCSAASSLTYRSVSRID